MWLALHSSLLLAGGAAVHSTRHWIAVVIYDCLCLTCDICWGIDVVLLIDDGTGIIIPDPTMLIDEVAAKNLQVPYASVYVLLSVYYISLYVFGFFLPFLIPKKFLTVSRVKTVMNFVILIFPLSSLIMWRYVCFVHQMNTIQVFTQWSGHLRTVCHVVVRVASIMYISAPTFELFHLTPIFAERLDRFTHFYFYFKLLSYICWENIGCSTHFICFYFKIFTCISSFSHWYFYFKLWICIFILNYGFVFLF